MASNLKNLQRSEQEYKDQLNELNKQGKMQCFSKEETRKTFAQIYKELKPLDIAAKIKLRRSQQLLYTRPLLLD